MNLKPLALGLTTGIMCAFYMLMVTIYPMFSESVFGTVQGEGIRALMYDVYPYYGDGTWYSAYVGIIFGFIDGFGFGLVFGWLYGVIAGGDKKTKKRK